MKGNGEGGERESERGRGREGERERKAEAATRRLGFTAKRARRAQGRFGMVAYGLCQHLIRILGFAARQTECTLGERRFIHRLYPSSEKIINNKQERIRRIESCLNFL